MMSGWRLAYLIMIGCTCLWHDFVEATTALPDTVYVSAGGRANIDVLANDVFDGAGRVLSVSLGQHSDRVLINTDGTVHYRPLTDFEGEDRFSYVAEASDGMAEGLVVVFVKPWSEMLVTKPDSLMLLAGQGAVIDILANDRYLGTRTIGVRNINEVRFGSDAFVTYDLCIFYRSDPGFVGEDRFFYVLADDLGNLRQEWVVMTVENRRPPNVALDDVVTLQNVDSVAVALFANDVFDSAVEQITIVPPMQGQATWDSGAKNLHYIPQSNFVGIDKFAYVVVLEDGFRTAAQVRMDVRPFNALPLAKPDSVVVSSGRGVIIQVLANDFDAEGDTLVVLRATSQMAEALVILNRDGSVFFRVLTIGTYEFAYEIADGNDVPVTGVVQVTVEHDDDRPLARDDLAFVEVGKRINIPVLANDDYQGDSIQVVAVTAGQYSDLVIVNSDQTVHYRTGQGYTGDDFFTYTIRDAQGREASGIVQIRTPGRVAGDFDDDGKVGFSDFLVFVRGFGAQIGDGTFDSRMDLNTDGKVGFSDFLAFVAVFGS